MKRTARRRTAERRWTNCPSREIEDNMVVDFGVFRGV